MVIDKIDDGLIDFAVEIYFEGKHLVSLERFGNEFVVVTKVLPVSN